MIGLYYESGGTDGEFSIEWIKLSETLLSPCLKAFNDSWKVLTEFKDVIRLLEIYHDSHITPEEMYKALLDLGFKDFTARIDPATQENQQYCMTTGESDG